MEDKMTRILDPTLLDIIEGLSTGGLPLPTARAIHRVGSLLLCATTLDDASIFGEIRSLADDRYAIPVVGK